MTRSRCARRAPNAHSNGWTGGIADEACGAADVAAGAGEGGGALAGTAGAAALPFIDVRASRRIDLRAWWGALDRRMPQEWEIAGPAV